MAYQAPEMEGLLFERTDAQKRAAVFLFKPETILIKVLAMGPLKGLDEKPRDNVATEMKHTLEAIDKGLNTMGVRANRTDTGFCLIEKEEGVRIYDLLHQMWNAGYRLVGAHWQQQNNKGPVNTFELTSNPGDRPWIRLKQKTLDILHDCRFNHGTVWCNLRTRADGSGQYRLDTINLAVGRRCDEPSRQLVIDGQTYRLV